MRRTSLTEQSKRINGRLATAYEHGGATVWVHDSARDALLVQELFRDRDLGAEQKAAILPRMLLADPAGAEQTYGDGFWEAVAALVWEAFGLDMDGSHAASGEAPVFDWGEDAGRIASTMRSVYGVDFATQAGEITYRQACDMLAGAVETGQGAFARAVYYRTAKPPKRTKHNGAECDAFEALRAHYALRGDATTEDAARARNDAMGDAFAAEMRAAKGARRG